MKNLELKNEPLDQKLIDFDPEKQNFYEKYNVTIWGSIIKESFKSLSRTQDTEGQPVIRELRSDVVHMKASAAPPNLTRDLEATIESQ